MTCFPARFAGTSKIVTEDRDTAHCELSFSPNVSLVPTVRRFIGEFTSRVPLDDDAASQLAIATHELLDNAVSYSLDGNTSLRVGFRLAGTMVRVTVETRNRAAPEDLATIRRNLDALAAASDPDAHFQMLMRETAKRPTGSGLGLARVRAESEMLVSYEIDDDEVRIRATAFFEGGTTA